MIEGAANEMPEAEFVKALEFAHGHAREMIRIQKELAAQVGKPKREMPLLKVKPEMLEIAYHVAGDRIEARFTPKAKSRAPKPSDALREEVKNAILEKHPDADAFSISQAFDYVQKKAFRISILEKQKRVDGRGYRGFAPDHLRSRRAPARAWLGHFSARRNPGACARYARADRRSAR